MINIIMNVILNIWNKIVNTVDKKVIKFVLPARKCIYCGLNFAIWKNSISNVVSCDDCVPRGCRCKIGKTKRAVFLQNSEQKKDHKGRDVPCEDWYRI
jgi:hypothetical protein